MENNECPTCTGKTKTFFEKYCEKHDVCICCGISRKDLTDTPWGTREGAFLCKDCNERQRLAAVKERQAKGFDHEYTDEITCPHCGYEYSDSWDFGRDEAEEECPECHDSFTYERIITCLYTTAKLEQKP